MKKQLLTSASVAALVFGVAGAATAAGPQTTIDGDVSNNKVEDSGASASNTIQNAGDSMSGITHMQANNGSANLLSLGTNVGALINPSGSATANAMVGSEEFLTQENHIGSEAGTRDNTVSSSLGSDSSGIAAVQQNDGHANVMGGATAVAGIVDPNGDEDVAQTASAKVRTDEISGPDKSSDDDTLTIASRQDRDNTINNESFDGLSGIATVQQNNGDGNAIGASTSAVGISGNGTDGDVASIDQTATADGAVTDTPGDGDGIVDDGSARTNTIRNSFDGIGGVATVQENNGTSNAMASATAVTGAEGFDAGDLQDGDNADDVEGDVTQTAEALGNIGNEDLDGGQAFDKGSDRDNTVDRESFDSGKGIATVQQNNGDVNSLNSATAVAGIDDDVDSTVDQTAKASGSVSVNQGKDQDLKDTGSSRTNTVDNSFADYDGVGTLQQNNGNVNAMNAATAVAAIDPDDEGSNDAEVGEVDQSLAQARDNNNLSLDALDQGSSRTNDLTSGSFDDSNGIVNVQQNNGDANTLNVASAVVATRGKVGDVTQSADADTNDLNDPDVGNGTTVVEAQAGADRGNNINNSFGSPDGVSHVQQNNGDANTLNAGTAVFGSVTGAQPNDEFNKKAKAADDVTQESILVNNQDVMTVDAIDKSGNEARDNDIVSSFGDADGVTIVQQNNGSANSVNAASALAGADSDVGTVTQDPLGGDPDGQGLDNNVRNVDVAATSTTDRDNKVQSSFADANGLHTLQQNNGDANTVNAATAVVAATEGAGSVEQEIDLTGSTVGGSTYGGSDGLVDGAANELTDEGSNRDNTVSGSFANTSGVVTVQQNNGSANSVNAATGVLYAKNVSGSVSQVVDAEATVSNNDIDTDQSAERDNTIGSGSFDGTDGVATVQQNNGDGNYMGSGTAVAATLGEKVDNVTLNGSASGNVVTNPGSATGNATNTVSGSFNNVNGVASVQQNNGDGNVIQSAISVSANVGN